MYRPKFSVTTVSALMLLGAMSSSVAYGQQGCPVGQSTLTRSASHDQLTDWGNPRDGGPFVAMPIQQFPTGLGTLNSAVVNLSGVMTTTARNTNNSDSNGIFMVLESSVSLKGYTPAFFSPTYAASLTTSAIKHQLFPTVAPHATFGYGTLVNQPAVQITADLITPITVTDVNVLNSMKAPTPGTMDFAASAQAFTLESSNGTSSSQFITSASATVSVTYCYDPAPGVTIGDTVFNDLNHNSSQESGEPGIPGVTVTLNGTTVLGVTVGPTDAITDADGHYTFTGLIPGTYSVTLNPATLPAGRHFKSSGVVSNASPAVLVSNSYLSFDFPFYEPTGSIGNFVWQDQNNNGIQDGGEPGLNGIVVNLCTSAQGPNCGTPVTATTNSAGAYSFTGLVAGAYYVSLDVSQIMSPPSSTQQGGNPALDSNLNPSQVTLGSDFDTNDTVDFGFFIPPAPGTIAGTAYNDLDHSSSLNGGDTPFSGVTVTLDGVDLTNTTVHRTTVSLGDGTYSFANVLPGTYSVSAPDPAAGKNRGTTSPLSGIVLASGATSGGHDFGYVTGTISGYLYNDANGNNSKTAGEAGLGGITVTLSGTSGGTAVTLGDGSYSFTGLVAGAYTVSAPATASGLNSSTTNPLNVTLGTGSTSANNDFGYVLPSVDLQITKTDGVGTYTAGTTTVYTITVRNAGPGAVTGATVTDSLPAGTTATWTAVGTAGATGFAPNGTGSISNTVSMTSGSSIIYTVTLTIPSVFTGNLVNTATVTAPPTVTDTNPNNNSATDTDTAVVVTTGNASIGVLVWNDKNGNGRQDLCSTSSSSGGSDDRDEKGNKRSAIFGISSGSGSETGGCVCPTSSGKESEHGSVIGVSVLSGSSSGGDDHSGDDGCKSGSGSGSSASSSNEPGLAGVRMTIANSATPNSILFTAITDANGNYKFLALNPGTYVVCVTFNTLPVPGPWTQTYDLDGLTTPHCARAAVTAGQNRVDVNFGYKVPAPASIGGTVWNDKNSNAKQDLCSTSSGDSSKSGRSSFGLSSGSDSGCTCPSSSSDDKKKDSANGTLSGGSDDGCSSSSSPSSEPGLGSVRVTIAASAAPSTILNTLTTDSNGSFNFTGLGAGSYKVCVVRTSLPAPGPWTQTYDLDGLPTPDCATVVVTAGQSRTDAGFGYHTNTVTSSTKSDK